MVGKSINSGHAWLKPELKLSEEPIPDGLVRYRFGRVGYCVEVFDVEPTSSKIVAVSFEGTEKQCAIPP